MILLIKIKQLQWKNLKEITKMKKNFSKWEYPKIIDGKPKKYNWIVQNIEEFVMGTMTDIGVFSYINALHGTVIKNNVQIGSHRLVYSFSTIDETYG